MRTIYVDVLLGLNLFINYFLLLAVSKFLSWEGKRGRLLLASLAGAFYALTILLPELPDLLSLLLKLLVSGVIIRIAWPFRGWLPFFKAVAVFYLINFAFAGFMLAIWYFIAPDGSDYPQFCCIFLCITSFILVPNGSFLSDNPPVAENHREKSAPADTMSSDDFL